MRRAVILTAILLVFIVIPIAQIGIVRANPYSFGISPYISIGSPSAYDIYQTTSIPIEVHVLPEPNTAVTEISYILDGGHNVKLSINRYENTHTCFGKGTLSNLTNGNHKVIALSIDSKGNVLTFSTTFQVNTTIKFPTLLLSPINTTYNKEIPLTYTVNDSKFTVYYQLDNSGQERLTGNTTLSGLPEGQHTINIHASDTKLGIISKQTANFTVDTTHLSPTPTPAVPESSYLPSNDRNAPHLELIDYLLPISILLLIIIVSVLLFKRYRKTANFKQ